MLWKITLVYMSKVSCGKFRATAKTRMHFPCFHAAHHPTTTGMNIFVGHDTMQINDAAYGNSFKPASCFASEKSPDLDLDLSAGRLV